MKLCRRIKTNGRRCRSPRLNGQIYCYFHLTSLNRHQHMLHNSSSMSAGTATYEPIIKPIQLNLPLIEDAESIQLSISMIVTALATERIDNKRAAVMLYGLQLASTNARNLTESKFEDIVREVQNEYGPDYVVEDEDDESKPKKTLAEIYHEPPQPEPEPVQPLAIEVDDSTPTADLPIY